MEHIQEQNFIVERGIKRMKSDMTIETERLILRKWNLDDADSLVKGLNNYNVSRWLAKVPYPYTKDDAVKFINYANSERNKNIELAIVLKKENKVIGGTSITIISDSDKIAGGGIWLSVEYHGKGYGSEAFNAKTKYSFEKLNMHRIENGYFKENIASKKMQEKLGFKDEGIRRKRFFSLANKEYKDECITGLLEDEYIDISVNR